ncbi:hypothetical protein JCM15764A_36490 [Geotalea toluenoxydans]
MKIRALLFACMALAGGAAHADQMVIEYRSGNVQTLRLDEPSSTIVGISYQEDRASTAESPSSRAAEADPMGKAAETAVSNQKITGTSQTNNKPQVRIEWAQPLE